MNDENPKNILCVANYSAEAGYAWHLMENFWVQVARFCQNSGTKCFLIYPEYEKIPSPIKTSPITVIKCDFSDRSRYGRNLLASIITENKIDALYLTDRPYFDVYYAYLRSLGVKTIIAHDHTPGDRPAIGGIKGFVKSLRNRISWTSCDAVFAVSENMRLRNIMNGRVPVKKCHTITNGITPIDCKHSDKSYVKKCFAIEDSSTVIVSTGRAHPYKRVDFIIECAHHLVHEMGITDAIFIFCGDGPAMPQLNDMIKRLELNDHFILAGRRNDIPGILCSSNIAIHASAGEGLSLSILEYMSAGLPVLVPDIPSVSQPINDGVTGIIYKDGDKHHVGEKIKRLIEDGRFRAQLSYNATNEILKKYTLDASNAEFHKALTKALGNALRGKSLT
ncbi:MAG: glycosyltransferase family 4 protein [Gammaproteobacteria bacterium]|nr:glycosyltransferase family 4 protein [Gammaproteobacteria bacterium]